MTALISDLTLDQINLKFIQVIDKIYQYEQQILTTPDLYYFQLESWYVGAAPVGKHPAYLGDLLILWQTSPAWFNRQPEITFLVDGTTKGRKIIRANPQGLRVFNVSGSALSGINSALAWDEATQEFIKFSAPTVFGTLKHLTEHADLRPFKKSAAQNIPITLNNLLERLKD